VYRATFDGGVRVTQGDQQIAKADTMAIDFRMEEQPADETSAPTTQRKPRPASAPAHTAAHKPAAAATTKPDQSQLPAVVHWTGKLVIVPIEKNAPQLAPGDLSVELASANSITQLNYSGWDVQCASCTYFAGGRGVELRSSPAVPIITVKNADGVIVQTPSLKYDADDEHMVLAGPSHVEFPMKPKPDAPPAMLVASWSKSAVLTVTGATQQDLSIQQADITGDVDVQHPQFKLKSDTVHVAFAPSADKSEFNPTQVIASGNVKSELTDEKQQVKHITTDRLTLDTKKDTKGELYPHQVIADGNVRMFDEEEEVTSGRLQATLAPATQPNDPPRIESAVVQQDVVFKSKQATGRASLLTVSTEGDDYNIQLKGQPNAVITSSDWTLTGGIINVRPRNQVVELVEVVGAGSLKGVQRQTPESKPTPFEITWDREMTFKGAEEQARLSGNVVVSSVTADGTKTSASGEELMLTLMDDPKAATQPAKPTSGAANPLAAGFEALGNKTFRHMTLKTPNGQTEVKSVLTDARGDLLRRMHLFAPSIEVDNEKQMMFVPEPGKLLYEDLRPATQPSNAQAQGSPLGDLSGATAFQWSGRLEVDQKTNRARILKGSAETDAPVTIVHQDIGGTSEPFRLQANLVTADFEKDPNASDKGADGMMPTSGNMKIKSVSAEGTVHFTSRQIQFDADQISYDPAQELMIARGHERAPVRVYSPTGEAAGSFLEIGWETRTQQIKHVKNVQATIRR
jgi:lipopolysaccharide export system protein LptA